MKLSVNIVRHGDEYIANCPELDVNCYGSDRPEAIKRIQSVIFFYIESARELGLDVEHFGEIMLEGSAVDRVSPEMIHQKTDSVH